MIAPDGVLCLHKDAGMTSHDAVARIRRLYGTRRVGHTGTLDPMATGLLVVMIGRAAKAAEFLAAEQKEYIATLRLGLTTDTQDSTGAVLTRHEGALPDRAQVERVCAGFVGEGEQIPPMYSAIKIGGQKLVDLARKNIEVERAARPITVYSLAVTPTDRADEYRLVARVSAGTYIRTLCADIGAALGCGGVMSSLERTACGHFDASAAVSLADLEAMSEDERAARLIPTEQLFSDCPAVCLPEFFEHLARSGAQIYQRKIGTAFPVLTRVRLYGAQGFFALGEVRDYDDGSAIKPIRQFVI